MTSPTTVSVVITFFNASTFLAEAVQSVVAQTYDRWEVLLVDDGSTDDSAAIAKSWVAAHPARMRYLVHPDCANRGISASRNLGIAHANGEFVAFLDADDVWLPSKLERQVHLLRAHPAVGMIYGRTQYWRSWAGNAEGDRRDSIPTDRIRAGAVLEPPALLTAFLSGTARVPCPSSVVVRRSLVEGLAGFEDSFRGLYEDQVFYAKVCLNAPVLVSDECLERYRQHAGSLCALSAQSDAETTWRRRYLHWLSRYVSDAGVVDPGLSRALRAQLWVWEEDRTRHLPRWTQRLVRRAKTTLVNVAALLPPSKTS